MTSRSTGVLAAAGVSVLAFSVAGLGHAGAASEGGWTVDTENCSDPDRASAPIEGTINIGSAMPLSGGAAAAAFAPAAQGFQSFITYANAQGLLPGYDIELTRAVADAVKIPVIASGGAGRLEHFYEALTDGGASAVLAASLFHFGEFTIGDVKEYLRGRGVLVR